MFEEKLCKIHWKITKRELKWKYFQDSLSSEIKFRIKKNWKNFDFFAEVNNWNCLWCYFSIWDFEILNEKYFLVFKDDFYIHSTWYENYYSFQRFDIPSPEIDISLIEDCESWASNVTYEVWYIDENIFKKEKILEEKNFLEKIDLFYVFIFIIFLVSIIFTIFSLRKLKKKS